jgi:hypothetical protein
MILIIYAVLLLDTVPLPPGKNSFAIKINNNNKIIIVHWNKNVLLILYLHCDRYSVKILNTEY